MDFRRFGTHFFRELYVVVMLLIDVRIILDYRIFYKYTMSESKKPAG